MAFLRRASRTPEAVPEGAGATIGGDAAAGSIIVILRIIDTKRRREDKAKQKGEPEELRGGSNVSEVRGGKHEPRQQKKRGNID